MLKLMNIAYQPGIGSGDVLSGSIEFQASITTLKNVLAPAVMQEIVKRLGCKTIEELEEKMAAWNSIDKLSNIGIRKDKHLTSVSDQIVKSEKK